ncbi:PTS sugar transporter subunit IIA [Lentilactobacillus sp. G22-6]|uniref:PTS sugar transporter subunit IIA n=1 Tax=Lentilactobacillus dabitei TaxID=2831523 RepID=UPI001C25CA8B|nr:PTS sugar transporter subunit IIA [Lentilactobacillus dabitei]MBU9788443.1 PTS sugar transporter subunit IIA [Lentilactobacillus dabitei]
MKLVNEDSVIFAEKQYTKRELFESVCNQLAKSGILSDASEVVKQLLEREEISDTRIDDLIAMPHCESSAVIFPKIILVNCRKFPIFWDHDVMVTGTVFLFIPTSDADEIKEIPHFVKKLADPDVTKELFESDNRTQFIADVHSFERR